MQWVWGGIWPRQRLSLQVSKDPFLSPSWFFFGEWAGCWGLGQKGPNHSGEGRQSLLLQEFTPPQVNIRNRNVHARKSSEPLPISQVEVMAGEAG